MVTESGHANVMLSLLDDIVFHTTYVCTHLH